MGRFSKPRWGSAVAGSHLFRNGQNVLKSWPKSADSSSGVENKFPITLIMGRWGSVISKRVLVASRLVFVRFTKSKRYKRLETNDFTTFD